MQATLTQTALQFALPKGRIQPEVLKLLTDAGIQSFGSDRGYRPTLSLPNFETKILKPQNVVEMIQNGSRDLGFAGRDWVLELESPLIELLDTDLNPVRVVAAAPESLLVGGALPQKRLRVATEYVALTNKWAMNRGMDVEIVRTRGATEVFPPEDADMIVDNTATGKTLAENDLTIIDTLIESSTCLFCNPESYENIEKRSAMDQLCMLLQAVLEGRKRVLLEVNVDASNLEQLVAQLPALRKPTIASLYDSNAYAVKAAVLKSDVPELIPRVKATGGSDLVISAISQLVK